MGIKLPTKVFTLSKTVTIKSKSEPTLNIRGNAGRLDLSFSISGQTFKLNKESFRGNWAYRASRLANSKTKKSWSWYWEFTGRLAKGNRKLKHRIDQDGKVTSKVREDW